MARFLIDAQLPPALADRLKEAGHEAGHVHRLGLGAASDRAIWDRACRTGATLITKDVDFLLLSANTPPPASIVWIRWGNVNNAGLWTAFSKVLPQVLLAVEAGERVIEVR